MIIPPQPMPSRPSLRRRPVRPRRLLAGAGLACVLGGGLAVLAVGPTAPMRGAAQAAATPPICVSPLIRCSTPNPSNSSPGSPPPPTHSQTSNPTPAHTTGPRPTAYPTDNSGNPVYVQPSDTPLPTLPPPSPGAPPAPPELSVQSINLQIASAPAGKPGGSVLVQGTLEAQRDADTYAVPHAKVVLTITAEPGRGANVIPAELDSGDTGVVLLTVVTSDKPGDTVVHAESGNASADITVHAEKPLATPAASAKPAAGATPGGGSSDTHGYLVASLAALVVALMSGYLTALALGRLPNPLQRRSAWGRRSGTSGR